MNKPLVVFLDLDGVFKTGRSILARLPYDPIASSLVNAVCGTPNTTVVISATCRLLYKELEAAQEYWRSLGMPNIKLHEQWHTTKTTGPRSAEIADWLIQHHQEGTEYLFIDDEMPGYEQGMPQWAHELIRTHWFLVGGHNNGMNYMQCRVLRELAYERKAIDEETAETEAEGTTGSCTQSEIETANRRFEPNLCDEISLPNEDRATDLCTLQAEQFDSDSEEWGDSEESRRLRTLNERIRYRTNPKPIGKLITYRDSNGNIIG